MAKYRIVNIKKKGFYDYYRVDKREWFIFPTWTICRSFDNKEQAKSWIENQQIKQTKTVVYTTGDDT